MRPRFIVQHSAFIISFCPLPTALRPRFRPADPKAAPDRDAAILWHARSARTRRGRLPNWPARRGIRRCDAGEAMNLFAALRKHHRAERHEMPRRDAGLLESLAPRRLLEVLARLRESLGDAPGLVAVVIARGVNEQDFELEIVRAVQKARRPIAS